MVAWQLTIDANDPDRLVRFWGPALDYVPQPAPDGFATWREWYVSVGVPDEEFEDDADGCDRLMDPGGTGPNIWFQVVPEHKAGKNRLHLDIYPSGGRSVPLELRRERVDAKVAELVEAGASVHKRFPEDFDHVHDSDHYFRVLQDPEGNEFCVA
jgi:hypothetical protein